MIQSLKVEHFRCFKSLELHDLKRINIVVGSNASGKTVLLEAIKLGLGANPQIVSFLNQLRGILPLYYPFPGPEQFKSYFIDLFHNFDDRSPVTFSIVDSQKRNASVKIHFDPKHAITIQVPSPPTSANLAASGATIANLANTIIPLAFDRVDFSGGKSSLYATVHGGGVFFQPGPELGISSSLFSGGYLSNPMENVNWFSQLSVKKESEKVIASVQKHFPFVRGLSSETTQPGSSALYADIVGVDRKIPAALVSWGFNRVLTFILAVLSFPSGVVLIDEIENGVYHTQHESLWRTLFGLAIDHDTQIFVSTHSSECLRAALPIVQEHESCFKLLRTERVNGTCKVTSIDGQLLGDTLEHDFDPR